ncbi:MAG: hypothetical protein HWN65_23285 [Candidatus Helarchaeota archaeon]|nr:hypothetical protein [Candidatus Helarchaeota archaeon]
MEFKKPTRPLNNQILLKFTNAVNTVRGYEDEAIKKFERIKLVIKQSHILLRRCPTLEDPPTAANREPAYMTVKLDPVEIKYTPGTSSQITGETGKGMDHYKEKAVRHTKDLLNAARAIETSVFGLKEFIRSACSGSGLPESSKERLKRILSDHKSKAESLLGEFEKCIEDIEKFREDYINSTEREGEGISLQPPEETSKIKPKGMLDGKPIEKIELKPKKKPGEK